MSNRCRSETLSPERFFHDRFLPCLDTGSQRWAQIRFSKKPYTLDQLKSGAALNECRRVRPVALHEVTHEAAASCSGRWTSQLTVKPTDSYAGATFTYSDGSTGSEEEAVVGMLDTALGGFAGEERFGLSHEGCGSDFSKARQLAFYLSYLNLVKKGRFLDIASVLSASKSRARRKIGYYSADYLEERSTRLVIDGTIYN